jgi:hypothetical protein
VCAISINGVSFDARGAAQAGAQRSGLEPKLS